METKSHVPQSNADHHLNMAALERDGEAGRRALVEDVGVAAEALMPRLAFDCKVRR